MNSLFLLVKDFEKGVKEFRDEMFSGKHASFETGAG